MWNNYGAIASLRTTNWAHVEVSTIITRNAAADVCCNIEDELYVVYKRV